MKSVARRLSSNHDARDFYDATLGLGPGSWVWANSEVCPEAEEGLVDTNPQSGRRLAPSHDGPLRVVPESVNAVAGI